MNRLCTLVALMVLSSSAQAGDSVSFVIGGRRIQIETSSHCRSVSCVASVSIPGIYQMRRGRDRYDDDESEVAAPAQPPVPAPVPVAVASPAAAPAAPIAAAPPAPTTYRPAATAAQEVAVRPPALQPVSPPPAPPPATAAPRERPAVAAPAAPPPQILEASQAEAEPAGTPIGDWQSEGKGSVRIERCGRALCGHAFNPLSSARGEAVLVNMKPKSDAQWAGNVYSVASGDTYYGTMTVTGPNALRVEACAMGRFYCTGNVWTRIGGRTERLITSRQVGSAPRS